MSRKNIIIIALVIVVILVGSCIIIVLNNANKNTSDVFQYDYDESTDINNESDTNSDDDEANINQEDYEIKINYENDEEMLNALSECLKRANIENFEITESVEFVKKRSVDNIEGYFKNVGLDYSKINRIENDKDLIYMKNVTPMEYTGRGEGEVVPQINIDSEYIKEFNETIVENAVSSARMVWNRCNF